MSNPLSFNTKFSAAIITAAMAVGSTATAGWDHGSRHSHFFEDNHSAIDLLVCADLARKQDKHGNKVYKTETLLVLCPIAIKHGQDLGGKRGARSGEVVGTMMGLSSGVDWGYEQTYMAKNFLDAGAANVQFDENSSSANQEGANQATGSAQTHGRKDAYNEWVAAAINSRQPSDAIKFNIPQFGGVANGFEKDNLTAYNEEGFFQTAVENNSDLIRPYIDSNGYYHYGQDQYYENKLIRMSLWEIRNTRGQDAWRTRFGYRDGSYRRYSHAWNHVESNLINGMMALVSDTERTYQKEFTKEDGTKGYKTETYTSCSRKCYRELAQNIFKAQYFHSFDDAFAGSQRAAFASAEVVGLRIGKATGQMSAQQTGFIREYDYQYSQESKVGYKDEYNAQYREQFIAKFDSMGQSAVIQPDAQSVDVYEVNPNGIFEANDEVAASILVSNYGGQPGQVKLQIVGQVKGGGSKVLPITIQPLTHQQLVRLDGAHGAVLKNLALHSRPNVGVSVNGGPASNDAVTIRAQAEIESMGITKYDPISGQGTIKVSMINPSKVPSISGVKLEVNVDNAKAAAYEGEALAGNSVPRIEYIDFQSTDVYQQIMNGVVADVQLKMGGLATDSASDSLRFSKPAPLAQYFHNLAVNEGVTLPSGVSRNGRIRAVQQSITAETSRVIRGLTRDNSNPWKDAPATTMAFHVKSNFPFAQGNPEAVAYYQTLGSEMMGLVNSIPKTGFFGLKSNKKEVTAMINSFSATKSSGKNKNK